MQNTTSDQNIQSKDLDRLPMFNPLSYNQYFPVNTVFEQAQFFQAQGSLQPFRNSLPCKNGKKPFDNADAKSYLLTTAETHNLFQY